MCVCVPWPGSRHQCVLCACIISYMHPLRCSHTYILSASVCTYTDKWNESINILMISSTLAHKYHSICPSVWIYIHSFKHTYTYIHTYTHTYIRTCTCVCVCMCVCVCVCVCVYDSIHTLVISLTLHDITLIQTTPKPISVPCSASSEYLNPTHLTPMCVLFACVRLCLCT
jgi:hypothetical protein